MKHGETGTYEGCGKARPIEAEEALTQPDAQVALHRDPALP